MTPVVIFAGGYGLRLGEITKHVPKPMLPVGQKPILETILDVFGGQGFKQIWLCVHYKAEQIEDYFGDGSGRGLKIKYIREKEPLGTGGALNMLPKWERPFIVSNADWMIQPELEFGRLMDFHARSECLATVCAGLYQHQVHYGVLDIDETGRLAALREKPIENFHVSAGIYVLEPDALDYAPAGRFDLPDLIDNLPRNGPRAGASVYPIPGQWQDLGAFETLASNHLHKTVEGLST
jgi:NDP-sugar pyrophosphorylase family protein